MKKSTTVTLLIAIALIGVYYFVMPGNGSTSTEAKQITIGYPNLRIALPVIVAKDKGYFKDEGLDVKIKS